MKIPWLGMNVTHEGKKLFNEAFCNYRKDKKKNENEGDKDKQKPKIIEVIEKMLGDYIKFTGRVDDILHSMFPTADDIQKLFPKKQKPLTLFSYHLDGLVQISKEKKEQWTSAWADLMYDLGEFQLDEILLDKIKENTSDVDDITDIIPHIYKLGNNWHVWWAFISDATKTIEKIWNRITGEEVQIISVDDDPNFADLFLGTKQNKALLPIEIKEKDDLDKKDISRNLIWINPITHYTGATGAKVKQQIDHIIDESKKDHLLVFVIDLIFKESQESTVIKGDELIRHLRNKKRNVLIVGITGGTSPFIINSAEKAGADIVVFKKRGGDPENIVGHSGGGNPIGVFDLLWAVSWNVSVWRLLEEYKRSYINNKNSEFENIATKFFSNIEDASPFWKKYLDKWNTDINKVKIKRLFR